MTITKLKNLLLALIFFSTYFSYAEIITVNNLRQVQEDFKEVYSKDYLPRDILVVVALDELIFKSLLPLASEINRSNYVQLMGIINKIYPKVNPKTKNIYINQVLLVDYKQELQYPDFQDFIKIISKNGTPIIAVNKGFTGNFNKIPKFEIWLADYLKKIFDIDFSDSFSKNNYIIFNNLPSFANTYPVFYKGILTANNASQHELVLNFLLEVGFMPKALIMISSNKQLLNSMQAYLSSYSSSMAYIGYHVINDQIDSNKKDLDLAYYTKFLNDLVNRVNKLQRNNPAIKTSKKNNKNPYDQTQ
jgi:hypothetical protein